METFLCIKAEVEMFTKLSTWWFFNFVIVDIICEKFVCLEPLLYMLYLFSTEDPEIIWSEPFKTLLNVI